MYQFLDKNNTVLYVGKAKSLKDRVSSYFSSPFSLSGKTKVLVGQVEKIKITIVESEVESLLLEASLIKKFSPKYNIRLTDGKMYPVIRILVKSSSPAILTARRIEDSASLYFGPFPNAGAMRLVLKTIRRVFPFQSVLNHPKRICLYGHLGLCPCIPVHDTKVTRDEYKKDIHHIIDFLEGNTKKVLHDLEKEKSEDIKKEAFEHAAKLQKQIESILLITKPQHAPFEYQANPHLREDLRFEEMEDLRLILQKHGVQIGLPRRIECYDNSNIQGINPTSSLVVLTNGEIDKSQYRKFKIKSVKGPNDFASMQEVLTRRFKHKEWPYPDLVIVDGGKGQVSSALRALHRAYGIEHREKIPIIGLAKRYETIITENLQEIVLPKSSPALQLIMRIRDEAHRFAITYHRKLRSKTTFS